jgi:hypothetical protein
MGVSPLRLRLAETFSSGLMLLNANVLGASYQVQPFSS